MYKKLFIISFSMIMLLMAVYSLHGATRSEETFSKATIKYGMSGGDVYELQGRLHFLGYYKGEIDGHYGWRTLRSVKRFQSAFGLKADGIVGAKSKLKLWQATKSWRPGQEQAQAAQKSTNLEPVNRRGLSSNDIKYMANAVYGEARGEPYEGQVAVAAIILNRMKSKKFPNTVYGVIFQPRAFTAVDDGQIWLSPDKSARKAVNDALNGWDPTGGCIYYFNPATATNKWIWGRPQVKRIGKHIFCK